MAGRHQTYQAARYLDIHQQDRINLIKPPPGAAQCVPSLTKECLRRESPPHPYLRTNQIALRSLQLTVRGNLPLECDKQGVAFLLVHCESAFRDWPKVSAHYAGTGWATEAGGQVVLAVPTQIYITGLCRKNCLHKQVWQRPTFYAFPIWIRRSKMEKKLSSVAHCLSCARIEC